MTSFATKSVIDCLMLQDFVTNFNLYDWKFIAFQGIMQKTVFFYHFAFPTFDVAINFGGHTTFIKTKS